MPKETNENEIAKSIRWLNSIGYDIKIENYKYGTVLKVQQRGFCLLARSRWIHLPGIRDMHLNEALKIACHWAGNKE